MKARIAKVVRKTKETDIKAVLNLDGKGEITVRTGIPFFDHMLTSLAKHAGFDLQLSAKGDTQVDDHHTVEDVGLVLGQALAKALGDKKGIQRFGSAIVPMDEARAYAALDISGRPCLSYSISIVKEIKEFDLELLEDFFEAFTVEGRLTLHLWTDSQAGKKVNSHHQAEAMFKASACALRQAVSLNPRVKGVPSTKGKL